MKSLLFLFRNKFILILILIDVTKQDISCYIDVTELDISCCIDVTELDISCCFVVHLCKMSKTVFSLFEYLDSRNFSHR